MPETTPLIKAALNLQVGAGFDVYDSSTAIYNYIFADLNRGQYNTMERLAITMV